MKKLFTKINLLMLAFCAEARVFLNENVEPVVKALRVVKVALDSPVADGIVRLTNSQLDDMALAHIRRWLPTAILSLDLPVKVSNMENIEEMLQAVVNYLRTLSPEMRNAALSKLATVLAQLKAGGTSLKESEIDLLVNLAVQRLKHGTQN